MLIDIEKLKNKIQKNKTAGNFFKKLCDKLKELDFEAALEDIKNGRNPYGSSFMITQAAYHYCLTGDGKSSAFVHDAVIACCSMPKWEEQGARNGWTSDLLTGDAAVNISVTAYIAPELFSEDERSFIQNTIIEKGFKPIYNEWLNPETRIHCLDTMGHNWWAVCVGGAGTAMLLADESTPGKKQYINEIAEAFKEWLKYSGDIHLNKPLNWGRDGDYSEYAGYMMYGITNMTVFEELYRRYTGDKSILDGSSLRGTPDFMLSFMQELGGEYEFVKFGDTHSANNGALTMLYFANRFNRGDMVTAFEKFKCHTPNPLAFIHLEKLETAPEPIRFKPLSVYRDTAYASCKTDGLFFAVKAGDSGCHNHRDCGTFTITYNNQELITDSGTCRYGRQEYLGYFCAPEAHNVIMFNGKGIRRDAMYGGGIHSIGTIAATVDEPDYKYILADCTGPYTNILQKYMRHIYIIKGMILMIDDIYAEEDGKAEMLLHYKGEMTRTDSGCRISNGGEEMNVVTIMPESPVFEVREGLEEIAEELHRTEYLSFGTDTANKRTKFITAYIFDNDIRLSKKLTGDILEIKLERSDCTERFIVNYITDKKDTFNNAHYEYDNIKTNAFVTYLRESDGSLCGSAVTNGFYLRHNGRMIFTSSVNEEAYIK